ARYCVPVGGNDIPALDEIVNDYIREYRHGARARRCRRSAKRKAGPPQSTGQPSANFPMESVTLIRT
ncbi:MAG: hypothetical protein WBS21_18500, partial [Candidatus Acidiferrum sp.]